MKTLLTILASLTLITTVATAHDHCETPRRVVGYTRCGDPIIATYEYVGRSRCGEPVYQWVTHYPRETEPRYVAPPVPFPLPSFFFSFGHHDHDRDYDHDHDRDYHSSHHHH